MIKGFRSKEAEKIFNRKFSSRISADLQKVVLRKLLIVDAATNISDLRSPPANHLEMLKGNRKGQYSIRVNKQLRICFYWINGDAYEIELINYHV